MPWSILGRETRKVTSSEDNVSAMVGVVKREKQQSSKRKRANDGIAVTLATSTRKRLPGAIIKQ